jgi:hypothetical protein
LQKQSLWALSEHCSDFTQFHILGKNPGLRVI